MSLVTRYRLFWAALMAALLGLAFWKNSRSYPHKSPLWRLGKATIDTGLVVLMVSYAPALLLMYVVVWLTSPFRNRIVQVTTAFASILAVTHLAGVVWEACPWHSERLLRELGVIFLMSHCPSSILPPGLGGLTI